MWYLQHQEAQRIIEERERQADQWRIEQLVRGGWNPPEPGPGLGTRIRGGGAIVAASVSRGAARLARALDPGSPLENDPCP